MPKTRAKKRLRRKPGKALYRVNLESFLGGHGSWKHERPVRDDDASRFYLKGREAIHGRDVSRLRLRVGASGNLLDLPMARGR